jgi:UPF0716 family protein affecting phage T7 exclusion
MEMPWYAQVMLVAGLLLMVPGVVLVAAAWFREP